LPIASEETDAPPPIGAEVATDCDANG